MPSILTLAASVLAGYAITLMLPLVTALVTGAGRAGEGIGLAALAYAFVSGATILALKARMRPISRARTFTLVLICWMVMVIAPMPVFMLVENMRLAPAFFEAASAVSVLGVSFPPAGSASTAMMIFRAATAWYAGLLTLVTLVYVLGPFHVGGLSNRHLRLVLHSKSSGDPRFARTVAGIMVPYGALTGACALALVLLGVPPFAAATAGLAALSTNGYLPTDTGSSVFNNWLAELILLVFIIIGGTSIIWHRMVLSRRWSMVLGHRESYFFILIAGIAGLATAAWSWLVETPDAAPAGLLLNRLFDAASTLSTAGIVHDPRAGLQLPFTLVIMLSIAGATAYSPGGGIKLYRLGAMIAHALTEARRLAFPRAVLPLHFGGLAASEGSISYIWSFFFIYLITMCLSLLIFSALGYELEAAMSLAVGALSSVAGLVEHGLGGDTGDVPGTATRTALALTALAGRVEILVLLAAGSRADW